MEEKPFSFGIEPIVKRSYCKSGYYSKVNKLKRKRRKGLQYRKGEENPIKLSLAGFAVVRNQTIMDVLKGGEGV